MKFYYVALTINPEQPVQTAGGRRLAYYTKKQQALKQRDSLNTQLSSWRSYINSPNKGLPYAVYCVESEPKEIE
nr:MAG TPA: hypothetical protein [Caudoviricetes sp.]